MDDDEGVKREARVALLDIVIVCTMYILVIYHSYEYVVGEGLTPRRQPTMQCLRGTSSGD